MAHTVVINSANFTKYVDRAVPYLAQASGYFLFGTDFAASRANLAPPGGNLTAVGNPTYGPGYATLTALGDYFATGVSVSNSHTVVAVASKAAGSSRIIGPSRNAVGQNAATSARAGGSLGGLAIAPFNPGTAYGFVASSVAGTSGAAGSLYTATSTGVLSKVVAANFNAVLPLEPVSIGLETAPYGAVNTFNIAAAMIFDTELSQSQIETIYSYFREKLPLRGITVY